jgi:lipopolysaccharide biosynthesis glycosyltransferase
MMHSRSIYIGYDPREKTAFNVARHSVLRHMTQSIPVHSLVLAELIDQELYKRPITYRAVNDKNIMWDPISDAPMSTEHANARFLTPHLAKTGWALFMDGDMLARSDVSEIFEGLDDDKAIYCVQHDHSPINAIKMDGQIQTAYGRKNWSSVVLFNCAHEANNGLTLDIINTLPGRDLHRFCWLDDSEIGSLDPKWNFLVGHSDPAIDPALVHFTSGTPDMAGYENQSYADEWRAELARIKVAA